MVLEKQTLIVCHMLCVFVRTVSRCCCDTNLFPRSVKESTSCFCKAPLCERRVDVCPTWHRCRVSVGICLPIYIYIYYIVALDRKLILSCYRELWRSVEALDAFIHSSVDVILTHKIYAPLAGWSEVMLPLGCSLI